MAQAPFVRSRGALDVQKGDQLFLRWENSHWAMKVYNLQALRNFGGYTFTLPS